MFLDNSHMKIHSYQVGNGSSIHPGLGLPLVSVQKTSILGLSIPMPHDINLQFLAIGSANLLSFMVSVLAKD